MNEVKYTLGPWNFHKIGNNYDQFSIYAENGSGVCNTVEREANARLIAASPELLEALRNTVDALCDAGQGAMRYTGVLDHARATIANAETP